MAVPGTAVAARARRAFTLMELAIVLVIVGAIAAVAIPRLASAAANAKTSALRASARTMQQAIEHYKQEHDGRNPAQNPDRSVDSAPGQFKNRLLKRTLQTGVVDSAGPCGPYLREIPANPLNGKNTVRIAGPAAGNGSAGWWVDPVTGELLADDSAASAAATK